MAASSPAGTIMCSRQGTDGITTLPGLVGVLTCSVARWLLFVTCCSNCFVYDSSVKIIVIYGTKTKLLLRILAASASVKPPTLHTFRRMF